jgi:hypothetical protein
LNQVHRCSEQHSDGKETIMKIRMLLALALCLPRQQQNKPGCGRSRLLNEQLHQPDLPVRLMLL